MIRNEPRRRPASCGFRHMSAIPIQNIYYLLCYAWNKLQERDITKVDAKDVTQLVDLFAKVLSHGTAYLFKKGLDRDYITHEDDTRRLRGKVLFGPSLKRNLFSQAMATCSYDELSYDVLHNRILKATIRRLISVKSLDRNIEKDLASLYRRFPEIEELDIKSADFRRVKLHRNNLYYAFLLNVCEIIHENLLLDEDTGEYRFRDFFRDEGRMAALFEAFVRNFFRTEQTTYGVKSETIKWSLEAAGTDDDYLPSMITDTSLEAMDGSRKVVIDTKFYKEALKGHYDKERVISANLYQIYAYVKNLEPQGGVNEDAEGVLLYPAVDQSLDLRFRLPGHTVRVKTLNLNQDWRQIHEDLMGIIA